MSEVPYPDYVYKAKVQRWVDGDSIYLLADLGFRTFQVIECRLLDLDTPERGKLNYKEATLYANQLAPVGADVILRSRKDPEKYGRWLVELWVGITDIDEAIVAAGLGYDYDGGTRLTVEVVK